MLLLKNLHTNVDKTELDDNKYKYFGYTSFQKKEWTLILNDLIQIYPDIEFI